MIVALTLAGAYVAACLAMFALQGKLIYPAPVGPEPVRVAGGEVLRFSGPGFEVPAVFLPGPADAPVVVHFHGNGEQLADVAGLVRAIGGEGVGVLAVEYPGYGLSAGAGPSEERLYAAAEAALGWLRGRGVGAERTVLLGQSLGSGVAAEMALRGRAARVVLLSPYTSIVEMAGRLVPWMPARLLVRHRFETLAKAPRIAAPVLIVHGTDDEVVPADMGRRLAAAFPAATLRIIDGDDHAMSVAWRSGLARCIADFARGRPCGPGEAPGKP